MPKIEGYHPVCRRCSNDNQEPWYKWCPKCRARERARRDRERIRGGSRKPARPYKLSEVIGSLKDVLPPDTLQVRPGHKEGWWEIV